MRVVIVGHAASPDRGSEPGNAWDWAWYLSRHHDVWLVNYPEFRAEVDRFLEAHLNHRLRIAWVDTARFDPWQPHLRTTGLRFKLHYLLWLAQMQKVVADLVKTEAIDIVHHVSFNTVSAPSRLWRLPVPFIWGPIGGGETAPIAFRGYYGKDWSKEQRRRLRILLVGKSSRLRLAVKHACYLMAANFETRDLLIRAGANPERLTLMMDSGVRPNHLRSSPRSLITGDGGHLTLLWAGRLEARKALPILLDALAGLVNRSGEAGLLSLRLLVAGDGPKRADWERHAEMLGLSGHVTFLGIVAPIRMAELYEQADVFVFTSLKDTFGSVVTEALSHALPTIVLNHQGCAAVVPDHAAIKVPVTTPVETVAALTSAIDDLRRRPQQLQALSERAWSAAKEFEWPARAEAMTLIYEKVARSER